MKSTIVLESSWPVGSKGCTIASLPLQKSIRENFALNTLHKLTQWCKLAASRVRRPIPLLSSSRHRPRQPPAHNTRISSTRRFWRLRCCRIMMAGPSTRPRGLATQTLKGAGLIRKDEDTNMKDLSHGRKKALSTRKVSSGHRQRSTNIYKTAGLPGAPQKTVNSHHFRLRSAARKSSTTRWVFSILV